jgi:hypothetical protein
MIDIAASKPVSSSSSIIATYGKCGLVLIMFEQGSMEICQTNERYKILEIAKTAVCGCSWKRSRIEMLGEEGKR